jgi:CheY-like chemotaxis protein
LRADRRTAPIPVVFCMARGEGREHQRLRALGAAGVIAKPFDAMRLAAEVRRIVAVEGVLSPVRECFLQRLEADAGVLSARRQRWTQRHSKTTLTRIREIAHSLADAGGIYGSPASPAHPRRSRTPPKIIWPDGPRRSKSSAPSTDCSIASRRTRVPILKFPSACCTPSWELQARRRRFISVIGFDRVGNLLPPGDRSCSTSASNTARRRSTPRGSIS